MRLSKSLRISSLWKGAKAVKMPVIDQYKGYHCVKLVSPTCTEYFVALSFVTVVVRTLCGWLGTSCFNLNGLNLIQRL